MNHTWYGNMELNENSNASTVLQPLLGKLSIQSISCFGTMIASNQIASNRFLYCILATFAGQTSGIYSCRPLFALIMIHKSDCSYRFRKVLIFYKNYFSGRITSPDTAKTSTDLIRIRHGQFLCEFADQM